MKIITPKHRKLTQAQIDNQVSRYKNGLRKCKYYIKQENFIMKNVVTAETANDF